MSESSDGGFREPGDPVPARPGSVAHYRVGGHLYPMKTVPNCLVCRSPYRMDIEEQLVLGRTYRVIEEWLPDGFVISRRAIGEHYRNKHMPLDVTQARAEIEARADRVGKSIEDSARSLIDGVTLLEAVVAKTFESIAKGELRPDVTDGLRATKMLADLGEYDTDSITDQQAYVEAFGVYQEEAQRIMGPEAFEKFGRALDSNPVLAALAARFSGAEPEPEDPEMDMDPVVEDGFAMVLPAPYEED